jgi:hypothetical protein
VAAYESVVGLDGALLHDVVESAWEALDARGLLSGTVPLSGDLGGVLDDLEYTLTSTPLVSVGRPGSAT